MKNVDILEDADIQAMIDASLAAVMEPWVAWSSQVNDRLTALNDADKTFRKKLNTMDARVTALEEKIASWIVYTSDTPYDSDGTYSNDYKETY